jgi:hypothetical protein
VQDTTYFKDEKTSLFSKNAIQSYQRNSTFGRLVVLVERLIVEGDGVGVIVLLTLLLLLSLLFEEDNSRWALLFLERVTGDGDGVMGVSFGGVLLVAVEVVLVAVVLGVVAATTGALTFLLLFLLLFLERVAGDGDGVMGVSFGDVLLVAVEVAAVVVLGVVAATTGATSCNMLSARTSASSSDCVPFTIHVSWMSDSSLLLLKLFLLYR